MSPDSSQTQFACQRFLWVASLIWLNLAPGIVHGETCDVLPPLPAMENQTSWNHTKTRALVKWSGKPNHRLRDGVYEAGTHPWLIGKFAYGIFDKDLKGEEIDLFLHDARQWDRWRALGTRITSQEENDRAVEGLIDDGGRIFEQVEKLPRGVYPVRARVRGDGSLATGTLYLVERDSPVVVFDIDGTLTRSDMELTGEILSEFSNKAFTPALRPHALALVREWVRRGALPVYLTGRPAILHGITRKWLQKQGFPPGPLILADRLSDAKPSKKGVGRFKSKILQRLQGHVGLNVVAAYGNASTDRFAYLHAKIDKKWLFLFGEHPSSTSYRILHNLEPHLQTLKELPPLSKGSEWPRKWR